MKKVSVIVPAYNAEKTLRYCIESILEQSYQDTEIIIVDDGSTDDTYQIGAELQKTDSRIILVRKSNGGVSSARNLGLRSATGNYVTFVDADDKLDSKMIEKLLSGAAADIVVSNVHKNALGDNISGDAFTHYDQRDLKNKFARLYKANLFNSVWGKLYHLSKIKDIRFDESVRVGEDLLFNFQAFKVAEKVSVTSYCGYIYITNINSATHRFDSVDFEQQKLLRESAKKFCADFSNLDEIVRVIDTVYIKNTVDVIVNLVTFERGAYLKRKLREYLNDPYYTEVLSKYHLGKTDMDRKRLLVLCWIKNRYIRMLQVFGGFNRVRYAIKSLLRKSIGRR